MTRRLVRLTLLSLVATFSTAVTALFIDQVVFRYLNSFSAPLRSSNHLPSAERLIFFTYHPLLGYNGIPSISKRFSDAMVTHNVEGNRGPRVRCSDPNDPSLMLVSGDSQAWGFGVGDNETISAALERKINALPGRRVSFANLGVSGYGPDQSLLKYILYTQSCKPKLVVFTLFVMNDFSEVLTTEAWGADKPRFFLRNGDLCLTNIPPPRAKGWPQADAATTLLSYVPALNHKLNLGPYQISAQQSQILEFLSRREFLSMVGRPSAGPKRVAGGDVISHKFPCYDPNPTPAELNALDGPSLVAEILARFEKMVRAEGGAFRVLIIPEFQELNSGAMNPTHAALVQLLRTKGIATTDLIQRNGLPAELLIDGSPWVWAPHYHLSARASDIAAERLLQDSLRDNQL